MAIVHNAVVAQDGMYHGWPANHGAWQWGDEMLVGFIRGKWGHSAMHNIVGPLQKVQARSLDGGTTWSVEVPNVDFECAEHTKLRMPFVNTPHVVRVCGVYDHGGDDCHPQGGYYASADRGKLWFGPFPFAGLEGTFTATEVNTSRTCTCGDLIFLSSRNALHWGTDEIVVAKRLPDGTFVEHAYITEELGRVVMPAVVYDQGLQEHLLVARRRGLRHSRYTVLDLNCWIDAYRSADGGRTWMHGGQVGVTGGHNGNPPALARWGDAAVCVYANRTDCELRAAVTFDNGRTWTKGAVLRFGASSDIGYPRLFTRSDGTFVAVYYWADDRNDHQRIESTAFTVDDLK